MLRYWSVVGVMLCLFLALFLVAEQFHAEELLSPHLLMPTQSAGAALIGVGLLIVDVLLPIPASLVMVAHGALFGVLWGTLLSLIGSLGAGLVGFAIGRKGGPLLARFVTPDEAARVNRLLAKWGLVAIILTRPIPLLAETTALMAGASPIGWGGMALATLAGALPTALIYAIAGASVLLLDSAYLTVALVLIVAGLFWLLQRRLTPATLQGASVDSPL